MTPHDLILGSPIDASFRHLSWWDSHHFLPFRILDIACTDIGTERNNPETLFPRVCDQVINERRSGARALQAFWRAGVICADQVRPPMGKVSSASASIPMAVAA
jgi:hypothetical protein